MSRFAKNVYSPGNWKHTPVKRRRVRKVTPSSPRSRRSTKSPQRGRASLHQPIIAVLFSKKLFSKIFILSVGVFILGSVFLTFAIASLSRNLPEPGRLIDRSVPISTKIYARDGKTLLYDIHGDIKRTLISLEDISPQALHATIVAEDRTFYTHAGFDIRGIIRSALLNIFKGGPVRGGSTITQQFIKNAVLTREKTITRKLKELILAYRIEKLFSKDEILNMYFNEIPYGSTIYGIEAASQTFFQKSAKDLDIIEAAIIASIPKAPTRLSPYGTHTDELVGRARHIIRGMVKEGYITEKEATPFLLEDPLTRIKPRQDGIQAPHFVFYVRDLLVNEFGEDFIEQGGMKVITTLDWDLQKIAEEVVTEGALRNEERYSGENAALVAQDPKTGQILAMVGSRGYFDEDIDGKVNVALRPRQPGSSFKPIVYAAAFKKGFTADTRLWDVLTLFKTEPEDYEPHNYNDNEYGLVTIRKAFAGSLNIPAVKTIYLTGIENVLDLADSLGYTTLGDRSRFGLSLVLGGGEVKLLEHVGAYSTLANDGNSIQQSAILRVEDSSGRVLDEWAMPEPTPVIDSTIAREIISIMSDNDARVFAFGENNPLTLSGRPVAAKTGTTDDFKDGWTLGFTPSLAVGIWVGNNDNTPMGAKAAGANVAGPIWNAFMRRALEGKDIEDFSPPEPRPVANPILRGQGMTEEDPHSILFYLDKNNLNSSTYNPLDDINFETWEQGIRKFLGLDKDLLNAIMEQEQELSEITPPTSGFTFPN